MKTRHILASLILGLGLTLALYLPLSIGRDARAAPPRAPRRELTLSPLERKPAELTGRNAPLTDQPIETHPSTVENPSQDLPEGAWDKIQAQLRRNSYELAPASDADRHRAANRAHGLRLTFDGDGVGVMPPPQSASPARGRGLTRMGDGNAWHWTLTLTGYGYEGDVRSIDGASAQSVDGNRIEYRHAGAPTDRGSHSITEWYVNDERGLEQGFTLPSPPVPSSPGLLILEMALDTTLTPHLIDEGQAILFRDADGAAILRYAQLRVTDAGGRELRAHLGLSDQEPGKHRVSILIDDQNAAYPLTVDPLLTSQTAKLTATDGAAYDNFGQSVAVSGDIVVVGAPHNENNGLVSGAAYVFGRNQGGSDTWGQMAKLTATDGAQADSFGHAVAVSGDIVVVGAPFDDDKGLSSGTAYVFTRNQGGTDVWSQTAKLIASDGAQEDSFGWSVAVSGDTIVVGAYEDDDACPLELFCNSGSAYVFGRNQGGADAWGQTAKLTATDGAGGDWFGHTVAVSGDTALVGAPYDDDNGDTSGSAYVFGRNQGGPDAWGQMTKLTATDGAAYDYFGHAVAVSGDIIVVGAHLDDDKGDGSGSAYVYRWEDLPPEITIAPSSLSFGDQDVDAGPTLSRTVIITNDGTGDLHISSVSLTGANAAEFAIEVDSGEATLTPGGTRTVRVSFDPSGTGAKSANLTIASDDDDEPTVNVALSGTGVNLSVYLPIVANTYVVAPDLVVQSVIATANDVQVVIENQGNATVVDEFWVQGYVNPSPAPTAVNQLWWKLGREGMFWGVTADALPLAPGQRITLNVDDAHYAADYSRVTWPLAAGAVIYVQADAWNAETDYGAIQESHEITGGAYDNNISTDIVQ